MTKGKKCSLMYHVYLIEKARDKCSICGLKLLSKEEYSE